MKIIDLIRFKYRVKLNSLKINYGKVMSEIISRLS